MRTSATALAKTAANPLGLVFASLLIFSLIGFLDSLYLTIEHYSGAPPACSMTSGCEAVTTSQYAVVMGVPIALLGVCYYLSIFGLAAAQSQAKSRRTFKLVCHMTSLGFAASLGLVYLQIFVIQALCLYCLLSAISSTALFALGLVGMGLERDVLSTSQFSNFQLSFLTLVGRVSIPDYPPTPIYRGQVWKPDLRSAKKGKVFFGSYFTNQDVQKISWGRSASRPRKTELLACGVAICLICGQAFAGDFDPAVNGGWMLQTNLPMVSTFSGAVSYQYSIEVPPGRNGLQPSVNLSYNSKRVDGIVQWQSSEWVGLGWSIDAIDIVRTDIGEMWPGNSDFWLKYENRFQLILNGASYDLQPVVYGQSHGRYFADDAPDLYIQLINDCSDDGDCNNQSGGSSVNKTTEYWIVRRPDGTEYRLGHNVDSEQVLFRTINHNPDVPSVPYSGPVPS